MDFRVLGPFEVADGGRVLNVGGQKPRLLLAALLLDANQVVPVDRLADALWEGAPPESAAKALQVYVSQLRRVIGRERLETAPPGYRLRVSEQELDLLRFEELAAASRGREALALWRGPPLPDLAERRFFASELARIEELRLACVEDRVEQDLAEGRHAAVVAELEAIVREHPLRERPRG